MSTADEAIGQQHALLIQRIQAGDPAAEEEFVNTYRKRILLIASVRTRDREIAKDVAQEVLLAVLLAIRAGQVREVDKLPNFVQGTTRNLINNHLRKVARRAETDLDEVTLPGADPTDEIESAQRAEIVNRELAKYSEQDKQILLLSVVDGHPLHVVAERLGLSHDAVRARKSRAIRRIIKKVAELSQKGRSRPQVS
jgi:RNA polymerase sigma factor (sigma-70 family)